MEIIKHRKIYFSISAVMFLSSIAAMILFGFNLGIDFTGGSLMQIRIKEGIDANPEKIQQALIEGEKKILDSVAIQPLGERGFILRFKDVSEDEHQEILNALRITFIDDKESKENAEPAQDSSNAVQEPSNLGVNAVDSQGNPVDVVIESPEVTIAGSDTVTEEIFESIGPTIGNELKQKSIQAVLAVLLAIILYIAWAFRKVSEPVSSWKYGVAAVIALLHDVVIPTGIFVVLGKFFDVEIDILYITAILTMLGFSVHDTIVVFDRTRENLARSHHHGTFEEIVNQSVNQTIRRSINTSATAFLALLSIYLFGGETVKYFVLALMLGIVFGTYSSIFIASPLLVVWEKWSRRR